MAGLSFIPSIGLLFAGIGVTWGLLSNRPRARLAVLLSAIGGLATVIEGVALIYFMQGRKEMTDAEATIARKDLVRIVVALDDYQRQHGNYPPTLQALVGNPIPLHIININDQSGGVLHIRTYHYEVRPDGTFDVFGVGPDGQPGTADDVRPVLPDSIAARTGYRSVMPAGPTRH